MKLVTIISRGKGFWKFNISLLHEKLYVEKIKEIIKTCEKEYASLTDRGFAWELTKMEIRSYTLPYCVKKKKGKIAFKKILEKELVSLQKTLDTNPTEINLDHFQISEKELEHIANEDIKAHIFRSKIKWSEEGERNICFFLNLEKRNYTNKLISALEINRTIIKDPIKISENQSAFYETLYSEKINQNNPCYDDNLNMFLQNNDMLKPSDTQKEFCEITVSQNEILKSITSLSNGRTPSTDGLPAD